MAFKLIISNYYSLVTHHNVGFSFILMFEIVSPVLILQTAWLIGYIKSLGKGDSTVTGCQTHD